MTDHTIGLALLAVAVITGTIAAGWEFGPPALAAIAVIQLVAAGVLVHWDRF